MRKKMDEIGKEREREREREDASSKSCLAEEERIQNPQQKGSQRKKNSLLWYLVDYEGSYPLRL